jgi:hypothetical protein
MDLDTLTSFFKCCTILNSSLLLLWFALVVFTPDFIINIHHQWFSIPRDACNIMSYAFIGLFKIMVLVFNAVPFCVCLIIDT